MGTTRAGTSYKPINKKNIFFQAYTAVHERIVVFFCSTYFCLMHVHILKYCFIFKKSASVLKQMRFFIVGKRVFLAFSHARALSRHFWIINLQKFMTGGNQRKTKYEFAYKTVSETEEYISAVIIGDRNLEDNPRYDYRKLLFWKGKYIFVRSPPLDSSFQKIL